MHQSSIFGLNLTHKHIFKNSITLQPFSFNVLIILVLVLGVPYSLALGGSWEQRKSNFDKNNIKQVDYSSWLPPKVSTRTESCAWNFILRLFVLAFSSFVTFFSSSSLSASSESGREKETGHRGCKMAALWPWNLRQKVKNWYLTQRGETKYARRCECRSFGIHWSKQARDWKRKRKLIGICLATSINSATKGVQV